MPSILELPRHRGRTQQVVELGIKSDVGVDGLQCEDSGPDHGILCDRGIRGQAVATATDDDDDDDDDDGDDDDDDDDDDADDAG